MWTAEHRRQAWATVAGTPSTQGNEINGMVLTQLGGGYGEGRGEDEHEAKGSSSSSLAQTIAFHTGNKDCYISVGGLLDIGFVSFLCFPVYCLVCSNKVCSVPWNLEK